MKILALEFSTDCRTVAVLDTGASSAANHPIAQIEATHGRSTRTCAMIESALRQAGLEREAVDTLAVGLGPGSYAGIRAAIAFASGWQLARPARLVGLSSVECLVAQLHTQGETGPILAAVDAQRGDFYLAGYELAPAGWREVEPLRLVSAGDLDRRLRAGARVVSPDIPPRFSGVRLVFPHAATLARLAASRPELPTHQNLEPIHLRPISFVKAPPPRVLG